MKRLVLALVALALVLSACAVGEPLPPTDPTPASITLNANVYSSIDGPTEYWFVYGEPGDHANWSESVRQTVEIINREAHPVSTPVAGLQPDHVYGWKVCVADQEEEPPREVCSREHQFGTVGDSVLGGGTVTGDISGTINFNVVSGPGGQNPSGTIISQVGSQTIVDEATCLRVNGNDATIGVGDGFYFVSTQTAIPFDNKYFNIVGLGGRDPTDCPEPTELGGLQIIPGPTVRDAP